MADNIRHYFNLLEKLVADEYKQEKLNDQKRYKSSILLLILKTIIYTLSITFTCLYLLIYLFKLVFLATAFNINILLLFIAFAVLFYQASLKKGSGLSVPRWFAEVDVKYLPLLCELPTQTLELGRLELQHGRDWFMKSVGSLIGFIDKVGLIPSILSLGALWAIPEKIPNWTVPIILSCILMYCCALFLMPRCRRLDRMIFLTELALKMKNGDNSH